MVGLLLYSCHSPEESNHAHDEHGNHISNSAHKDDVPSIDFTKWTDKTELFVEFPILVVGQTSRFAAHFTQLEKHQAVEEGEVTVSLIVGDKGIRHSVVEPSSPGIFTPSLKPLEAGVGKLVFDIQSNGNNDQLIIEPIQVYNSKEEVLNAVEGTSEEEGISFLKEQAWKMDFQTEPVLIKPFFNTISTSGVWESTPNSFKTMVAKSNGNISFLKKNLTSGAKVKKGENILVINGTGFSTNNLKAEIDRAKKVFDQIETTFNRKKSLYENKVISKVEFEEIEKEFIDKQQAYQMLLDGRAGKPFASKPIYINAPFDGYLQELSIKNGDFVREGQELFEISDAKTSILKISVSPDSYQILDQVQDIHFKDEKGNWESMRNLGGKILSVENVVSPTNPMVSIFTNVNKNTNMPRGSQVAAEVLSGQGNDKVIVPKTALLEDYGQYSVIVQKSGEQFEKRTVIIGGSNGNEIEIVEGLTPGEMIVSVGAYQVKMAALSGQAPAHGHAH